MKIEKFTTIKLQELMNNRNWSNYKLAKETGIAQSNIAYILDENNTPSFENLEKICDAFGISISEFFDTHGKYRILSDAHRELLVAFEKLKSEDKRFVKKIIDSLGLLGEKE